MTLARAPARTSRTTSATTATGPDSGGRVPHARRQAPGGARVVMPQRKSMRVSSPGDPMEREAAAVAARVTSGSRPKGADSPTQTVPRHVQRDLSVEFDEQIQRDVGAGPTPEDEQIQRDVGAGPASAPLVTERTHHTIAHPGTGQAMPRSVRGTIEPHLGVGLDGVRVHADADAAHAATSLGARAFTVGNNIFLNRGESANDVALMAHEATHVAQQGGALYGMPMLSAVDDEAQLLPSNIRNRLADYARHIPGYTLFCVIIEYDPLRGTPVRRNAMNLVEGLMGLVPGGTYIFDQLKELGVLDAAFSFITQQLASFDLSLSRVERMIQEAWDEMDFVRLDPIRYNIAVAVRHATRLLDDVKGFAASVVDAVMQLIKDALIDVADDLLADNAAWALLKKVLRWDPLRGEKVEATTVEILEDFLILIGRETELEQMKERDTLQKTADWLDTQIDAFSELMGQLTDLFKAAWDAIQPMNLPNLPSNLADLGQRVGTFLQGLWDFATTVAIEVLAFIKDALLGWLSTFAHEVPGFHLVTVLLGRDPFTGETVERNATNIIRGFISLLPGGNTVFEQLSESGVIPDAAATIEGAVAELGISWDFIVGLFTDIWASLSIDDLIDPIGAFTRIRDQFGEPIGRLFAFIRVVVTEVFKLILAVMNFPSDILGRIITNAMQAFEQIKQDPVGFLLNMLAAVKLGFSNFFDNFLSHLVNGLVEWLFRGLRQAGIEPPSDLSLGSILDVVLQVLGVSMDQIWAKLAERFGQETIDRIRAGIDMVVGIWTFANDVAERGVSAIWEYIADQISGLWNMVLDAATSWIMEQVVNRVVARLLTMLDPSGVMAVVNSFIAFFNAVQSAIEYLRDILLIIDDYVSTIAEVAAGNVEPGAAKMETGLANAIPVAIGFLANQVGLGNIGDKMTEIIGQVRALVDEALDWLLDKLQEAVNSVLAMLGFGDDDAADGEEGGIRDQVRQALLDALGPDPDERSRDEAVPIAAGVFQQFQQSGVSLIEVGPVKNDGSYDIWVAASPKEVAVTASPPFEVKISSSSYPESAQHIQEAIAAGYDEILTIDRGGARSRRRRSIAASGLASAPGMDRDEYPPAMFTENAGSASVKLVTLGDNRGAGSTMGNQLRGRPNRSKVKIVVE